VTEVMRTMQEQSRVPEEPLSLEAKHARLQALVGELLQTNQELRFKVRELEREKDSAERGLKNACATAALLLP